MKKLVKVLMIILLVLGSSPITINAENTTTTTIVSDEINLQDMEYGVEYVVYDDNDIVLTITVEIPISLSVVGDSGWSGGTIPAGASTLKVQCYNVGNSFSYYLNVMGMSDGPRIISAYNLSISLHGWTINSTSLSIIKERATNSSPAMSTATFNATFIQGGIVLMSYSGYLTFEINAIGNVRTTYSFV